MIDSDKKYLGNLTEKLALAGYEIEIVGFSRKSTYLDVETYIKTLDRTLHFLVSIGPKFDIDNAVKNSYNYIVNKIKVHNEAD